MRVMSSESFRERLRRLRRDDDAATVEPRRELSDELRARLDRRRARGEVEDPVAVEGAPALDLPARTVGSPEGLDEVAGPDGVVLARTRTFDAGERHGDWRLDEAFHVEPRSFALLTGDEQLAGLDLSRAVFLDTETTGLGGGAGTYVYMIGLGRFEVADGETRFHVWQGFLAEPSRERALLAEVARRVEEADSIVSFFGKSFDRHRLEDKMRIVGVDAPFAGRAHLDLFHPFSRLSKGRLADGRLATVESSLCGVCRQDDLPGVFAPEAWFDFLAGRAHRLEGVFRHNLDDVVSLVTLAAYLGRVLAGARRDGLELAGSRGARARAIARALADAGEREEALEWTTRAIQGERADGHGVRDLLLARAELLRRLGRLDAAQADYDELLGEPEDVHSTPALIGLAKLLEHGRKDLERAHEACLSAASILERQHTGASYARLRKDLARRTQRLCAKLEPRSD